MVIAAQHTDSVVRHNAVVVAEVLRQQIVLDGVILPSAANNHMEAHTTHDPLSPL